MHALPLPQAPAPSPCPKPLPQASDHGLSELSSVTALTALTAITCSHDYSKFYNILKERCAPGGATPVPPGGEAQHVAGVRTAAGSNQPAASRLEGVPATASRSGGHQAATASGLLSLAEVEAALRGLPASFRAHREEQVRGQGVGWGSGVGSRVREQVRGSGGGTRVQEQVRGQGVGLRARGSGGEIRVPGARCSLSWGFTLDLYGVLSHSCIGALSHSCTLFACHM